METFSDDLQLLLFPVLLDLSPVYLFIYFFGLCCSLFPFLISMFILPPGRTFYTLRKAILLNGEAPPHSCMVIGF